MFAAILWLDKKFGVFLDAETIVRYLVCLDLGFVRCLIHLLF